MASIKVSLKLLIDKYSEKVLFAEAGKDFIDFLFSLLSLPIGTVVRLLTKQDMVGSLGKLYESIENLNETYIQSNQNKDFLLKPRAAFSATEVSLLMPETDGDHKSMTPKLYMCEKRCNYGVTVKKDNVCPHCRASMIYEVPYVGRKVATEATFSSEGGFVKDVVTANKS